MFAQVPGPGRNPHRRGPTGTEWASQAMPRRGPPTKLSRSYWSSPPCTIVFFGMLIKKYISSLPALVDIALGETFRAAVRIKTEVNEETLEEERLGVCGCNVASERRRMIYCDQDDRQSNTMMMMTLVESQDKTVNHYKFVLKFSR